MNIVSIKYSGSIFCPDDFRTKILRLEADIMKMPQTDFCVRNIFSPGIYMRELTIPAGVVLTGAEHKTKHLNILSKGRITVWTEAGMVELSAPYLFESKPGTKRVGFTHEETVWTTIHANEDDETNMDVLVSRLTTSKYEDLLENKIAMVGGGTCLL